MKYIKLYEQHNKGITFKEWLIKYPQDINTRRIECPNSNLIDLEGIQQFKNLKNLKCSHNKLTELPNLPDSLTNLYCNNNNLTSLPELPYSLTNLYCYHNKLTSLPDLPDSLQILTCDNNKLTSLPNLPDSLKILYCQNNNLPYAYLNEYKKWHKETYPYLYKAKNYNI